MVVADIKKLALIVLAVSGCTGGCGPEPKEAIPDDAAERYAATYCAALFDCDKCLVRTEHGSEDECRGSVETLYQNVFDSIEEKATFHEDCFDGLLTKLERGDACDLDPFAISGCDMVTGTRQTGESCEGVEGSAAVRVSTCRDGLLCFGGTCRTTPISSKETQTLGDPCSPPQSCVDGLACVEGTCVQMVGPGEQCSPGYCEGAEFYCGSGGTCQPRSDVGDACEPEGSSAGCNAVKEDGWGLASWCVNGMCGGAQPLICSSPG